MFYEACLCSIFMSRTDGIETRGRDSPQFGGRLRVSKLGSIH